MNDKGKLDGTIVRNISEIEEAHHILEDEMSQRLTDEIIDATKTTLPPGWVVGEEEYYLCKLYPSSWVVDEEGTPDFSLALGEIDDEDSELEHTWLACAVQSEPNPSSLGIYFRFNHRTYNLTEAKFGKLLADDIALLARLQNIGFNRSDNGKYLVFPVKRVEQELLAKAYEEDDFDAALEPITTAISKISGDGSKTVLDGLIDIVRAQSPARQ
ncbi:hypothetical protein [Qipengyuania sp. SM2507]